MNEMAVRPKLKTIQPNSQETDDNSGIPNHQLQNKTSMTLRVAGEVVFLMLVVSVPLSVQAGFFSKLFSNNESVPAPENNIASVAATDIPLLTAIQNPDPQGGKGGAEILVDSDALVSTGPVGEDEIAEMKSSNGEIRVYTVRDGDSLSQIAELFDVTTNTIMWANDLTKATAIQPGDTLVILPIAGVRHIVKDGDTISTISKKYEGDTEEILSYNQLASADEISIGDVLIIPGGAVNTPTRRASQAQPVRVSGASGASSAGFSHPAPGSVRTQGIHGYNGVDLAAGYGSPIRAAASGEVIVSKSSGWNGGYGNYVVIKHPNGAQTLYAHLSSNYVGVGSYVSQGEVIGGMGSTGRSTGTHLHFEVRGARNPF